MLPAYGELLNISMFWYLIIGICIIASCVCAIVYLWCALSESRRITHDIIGNVNETTVIYDRQDKPCFININTNRDNILEFLQTIDAAINKSGCIPENLRESSLHENALSCYEGEIKPFPDNDSVFLWKMCPVIRKNKYLGRIYVFNDITEYKKLLEQLDQKNKQLKEALEAQRKYAEVAKQLAAEKERERIMGLVNAIAGDYLEQLRLSIKTMEKYATGNSQEDSPVFEAENDRMIRITRETIGEIRKTVQALHASG